VAGERVTPDGSLVSEDLERPPPRIISSPAPRWTGATALLERAETAAAQRALPEVMGGIHHRASPLPGVPQMLDGDMARPSCPLEALLGPQRAAILRMLDRPCQAGDVARRLTLTPGGVTHHLKALEASGLIVRERDARNVRVHRTARGTLLLGLYESA
jgi:DNA-binding transcriptional ArsR family regulator